MTKKRSLFFLLSLATLQVFAQSFITEIGQSVYDLQTNATIGARVLADEHGISAVWTQGMSAPTFPDRGTGYNHWNPSTSSWNPISTSRIEAFRTGWPSIVHTADGMEWVFSHDGIGGIASHKRDLVNNGEWVSQGYVPTAAPEVILWNRACAGGTDGNTIHLLASTTYNGTFINGLDQQILYYRSQDGGATWDIVDMTFEGMSAPMWGFEGDTYAMAANGNTVAVAIFGTLQDSYVWISNDNGTTWTRYLMNDFPLDNYQIDSGTDIDNDGVADRITSTSTSGSVGVDNNGDVHVSFATMDYIDDVNVFDNNYSYYRASGVIKYWNSANAGVPLDASDDVLLTAAVAPGMIGDVNVFQSQLGLYGFGGLVNHPSIVLSEDGEVFILFDGVKEGSLQNDIFRRHLFMVKSTDGGNTWSEPVDVSPSLDGNNWEYNFACAASRVYDGKIHMTAQRDFAPGISVNSGVDFGINSVVYVAVDASTLSTVINGCTDPSACNYAAEATQDDGSCVLVPSDEICDGIDNDCNGEIDNGVLPSWYQDNDGDGFGSAISGTWISCNAIEGYVLSNSDCDDFNVTYQDLDFDGFGGDNVVSCGGVLNSDDCNDLLNSVGDPSYYVLDVDGDGYHVVEGNYLGCSAEPGYILYSGIQMNQDCDDNDANVGPVNYYDYDNDGDGFSNWNVSYIGCFAQPGYIAYVPGSQSDCDDNNFTYEDLDGDGFGSDELVACGGVYNTDDCDDNILFYQDFDVDGFGSNNLVACAGSLVNTDCDDFNSASPTTANTWYFDYDGDGFGWASDVFVTCDFPAGYVLNSDDCYPYALTYGDEDGDYYGNGVLAACGVFIANDCDDSNPAINEVRFYLEDQDNDGFGSFVNYYEGCPSPGYILYNGLATQEDCDDNNPNVLGTSLFLFDNDQDGFGSFTNYYVGCSIQPGYLLYTGGNEQEDCDENSFTYSDNDGDGFGSDILVGCNGLYNSDDCDDNLLNYQDLDGDGAGSTALVACDGSLNFTDCDDNDALSLTEAATYFYDVDADGFGWYDDYIITCFPPNGYVSNSDDCQPYLWTYEDLDFDGAGNGNLVSCGTLIADDCDDSNPEIGNGEYFALDTDGDGFVDLSDVYFGCTAEAGYAVYNGNELQQDCNDGDANIGGQSLYLFDGESDGFGTFSNSYIGCVQSVGYLVYVEGESQPDCNDNAVMYMDADYDGFGTDVLVGCGVYNIDDCNDQYPDINPNAQELCNEVDDDCDIEVDEFVQTEFYADNDGDGFGDINNTAYACTVPAGYVSNIYDCDDSMLTYEDMDGDGFGNVIVVPCGVDNNLDCDDYAITINPGEVEVCNYLDDNCSGDLDEGVLLTFYNDADGDGYGDALVTTLDCGAPDGFVANATDCDDQESNTYPSAPEVCNYVDDNCNGDEDEGVQTSYYRDADGDGFGNINVDTLDCAAPVGYVLDATDCDDANAMISPAGIEVCNEVDDDCDIEVDEFVQTEFYADNDGDGFGDLNNTTYACSAPSGYLDNPLDCDDNLITYEDMDGDGYGSVIVVPCGVVDNTDCNDADLSIYPTAIEICNYIDENCSGAADEGVQTSYYRDADGDGFGNIEMDTLDCSAPVGYVLDATDCDDANAMISPAGVEVCNEVDDDCDIEVDEFVQTEFYADNDGDGFGDLNNTTYACSAPSGYLDNPLDCDDNLVTYEDMDGDGYGSVIIVPCGADNATDCDDQVATTNPGSSEICNEVDDNCDGSADEGVQTSFYQDADADGFGDITMETLGCVAPLGFVADATDCNDADAMISPAGVEVCNEIDDNCNVEVDEFVQNEYFADMDGDGFGDLNNNTYACTQPVGYVVNTEDCDDSATTYEDIDGDGYGNSNILACGGAFLTGDCDDNDDALNPGAVEICNDIDDNCNIEIDEFVLNTYYSDLDGDGYGDSQNAVFACSAPQGFVDNSSDCDDTAVTFVDVDGDGYGTSITAECGALLSGDCDDNAVTVNPGEVEICNGTDEDCDGSADNGLTFTVYYTDADGDNYGTTVTTSACSDPGAGFSTNTGDCDDADANVNPGATEVAGNDVDEDCDGVVGIDELAAFIVNLYPNPSSGDLNVVWSQQQDVMWQVMDMSGRVVERGNVKGQSQLKLSGVNWESGVYHVVLTLQNGTQKTMPWMLQR